MTLSTLLSKLTDVTYIHIIISDIEGNEIVRSTPYDRFNSGERIGHVFGNLLFAQVQSFEFGDYKSLPLIDEDWTIEDVIKTYGIYTQYIDITL